MHANYIGDRNILMSVTALILGVSYYKQEVTPQYILIIMQCLWFRGACPLGDLPSPTAFNPDK